MGGRSGALVQVTEHLSGFTEPTARGRDLRCISAVLVVAVLWSFRSTAAVRTTVHSAPPPPGNSHGTFDINVRGMMDLADVVSAAGFFIA
jgi:hypothetical protein